MKRKLFTWFLIAAMLFCMVPAAYADESTAAILYDAQGKIEKEYTAEELQTLSAPLSLNDQTLELQQDVTIPMVCQSAYVMGIELLDNAVLDLNGYTLTFKVKSEEDLSSATMLMGIDVATYGSEATIKNGEIIIDCSALSNETSSTLPQYAITRLAGSFKLNNVSIKSSGDLTAAIYGVKIGDNGGDITLNNCVFDSTTRAVVDTFINGTDMFTNDDKVSIKSGSYPSFDATTGGTGSGKHISILEGSEKIDVSNVENKIVIISPSTTAMVVEDGNAYLYDTMKDAVDAKGHSESGPLTTIQLMKSTNEELTVDENSSLKLESYNDGNIFTGTIVDQFGNTIGAAESQSWTPTVTNGIATVPEGGSIITQGGTTITAGNAQDQTPSVNADGTITVPVGATVQKSGESTGTIVTEELKFGPATEIKLDRDTLNLYSNTTPNTATLVATVTPENTTDAVTWESSAPDIASVTQNGVVTAHKDGTAIITAKAGDKTDTCTVNVSTYHYTGKYSYEISVAQPDNGSVAVDKYATEGETVTITATPNAGYMLDTLSVTAGGKELEVIDNGDGTYSFTMPSSKVSITAAFAEDPDWVDPEQPEEPGTTTVADIFSDVVPGAWYTDAVQYAYDNGLMTGTSATTFEPNTTTTRGMIVSMLHRLEGSPAVGIADFSDVASGDWYADPVAWAASEGIVGGYGDGTFGPNDPITREQMASILYRYADYKGLDVSARASLDAYSDADSVSPWASDVMSWAVSEGIISGMSEDTLAPQGTATRAQVAAMFQRFLENVMA